MSESENAGLSPVSSNSNNSTPRQKSCRTRLFNRLLSESPQSQNQNTAVSTPPPPVQSYNWNFDNLFEKSSEPNPSTKKPPPPETSDSNIQNQAGVGNNGDVTTADDEVVAAAVVEVTPANGDGSAANSGVAPIVPIRNVDHDADRPTGLNQNADDGSAANSGVEPIVSIPNADDDNQNGRNLEDGNQDEEGESG